MVKFTVYRTTNSVNGRIYIGVHKTGNPYDSYKGSGKVLKQAFRKYGKRNFTKEVLFVFDTLEEAYAKEKELVCKEFLSRSDVYNVATGGSVSPTWDEDRKAKQKLPRPHMRGRKLSEEHKKRIAESGIGRRHSEESKRKISEAQVGKMSHNKGKVNSKESNEKRSLSHLNLAKKECPHCHKSVDPGNGGRWHFDKCRERPRI